MTFIAVAFIRMRYTRVGLERPYAAPGGLVGAWIAAGLIFGVFTFALCSAIGGAPVFLLPVLLGSPAILLGVVLVMRRWGHYTSASALARTASFVGSGRVELPVKSAVDAAAPDERSSLLRSAVTPSRAQTEHRGAAESRSLNADSL